METAHASLVHVAAEEGDDGDEDEEEEEDVEHVPKEEFLALVQDMLGRAGQQQEELAKALQSG